MAHELIDLYEENEKLELESSLFRRKALKANEKRYKKMAKQLDNLIDSGEGGEMRTERLIRNMKNLEDMMAAQKKEIPDIDVQYKALLKLFKEKYPQELERMRGSLIRKLQVKGELAVGKS